MGLFLRFESIQLYEVESLLHPSRPDYGNCLPLRLRSQTSRSLCTISTKNAGFRHEKSRDIQQILRSFGDRPVYILGNSGSPLENLTIAPDWTPQATASGVSGYLTEPLCTESA